jgi:hypothetical protein
MKARFLAMGAIISILGLGLLASRGYSEDFLGLIGVGVLLLIVGVLWKSQRNPETPQPDRGLSQ